MELISFTFAAGETKRFERAGRYLEIIDAAAAVNVSLTDEHGGAVDYAQGALSGLYMEGAFSALTIYSATAQTVELLVTDGRGGSRRQPGNVRVIDEVGSDCQTIHVGVPLAAVAFRLDTLLAAGASAAGAMVRALGAATKSGGGGASRLRIVAAESPPASFASSAAQIVLANAASDAGSSSESASYDLKKKLPPGWGVWVMSEISGAAAASASAFVSVEV